MEIGDKVWIFDSNNRVYQDDNGNKLNTCWYKGYFVEQYIIAETRVSWIVGCKGNSIDNKRNIKVNKKTLTYNSDYGKDGILYTSEEVINKRCWVQENRYNISKMVERCDDYNKLVKIYNILKEE